MNKSNESQILSNAIWKALLEEAVEIKNRILITGSIFINAFKDEDEFNYIFPIDEVGKEEHATLYNASISTLNVDLFFYHLGISFLTTWGNVGQGVGPTGRRKKKGGNFEEGISKESIVDVFQIIAKFIGEFPRDKLLDRDFVRENEKKLTHWLENDLKSISTVRSKLMHLARPKLFIPMDKPVSDYLWQWIKKIDKNFERGINISVYLAYLYLVASIITEGGKDLTRDIDERISPLYVIDKHFWIICNIWDRIKKFLKGKGNILDDKKMKTALSNVSQKIEKERRTDLEWIPRLLKVIDLPIESKKIELKKILSVIKP